ncbi:MAG: hypothetical protein WCI04_03215, partial [archaeon]
MAQKKFLSIIFALILLISFSSFAGAVTLVGPSSSTLCQCETVNQTFSLCASVSGNYNVSINGAQSNWISVAQSSKSLSAGECVDVFLFATPSCFGNSGEYNYTIDVSGTESIARPYKLLVSQCHSFSLGVLPDSISAKPCQVSQFDISLKNTGTFIDEYIFSQKGLPDAWVTYQRSKIVLAPNAGYDSKLLVKTNCAVDANTYPFDFSVSNTRTNSASSKNMLFFVENITPFSIGDLFSIEAAYSENSCEEFDKNVSFNVKSISDNLDDLTISLLDLNKNALDKAYAYFDKSIVQADSNIDANINLIIKKQQSGEIKGFINVKSKNYAKEYALPFLIKFDNCYDLSISTASINSKECFGNTLQNPQISNTGKNNLDLNISIVLDGNVVETKSVGILQGETVPFSYFIFPKKPGTSQIRLLSQSNFINMDYNYAVEFENCFDSNIKVDNFGVCSGEEVEKEVVISNKGTRTQNFSVSIDSNWLNIFPARANILPGESKSFYLKGLAPINPSGGFVIKALSNSITLNKAVSVESLSNNVCNDIIVSAPNELVSLNSCSGKVIDVNVKNAGHFIQNIFVKKISPEWLLISEENFDLNVGETKSFFIYCSPGSNSSGSNVAKLLVYNDKNISKEVNIDLIVSGEQDYISKKDIQIYVDWKDNNAQLKYYVLNVVIKNDSNSGFLVNNIALGGFNSYADFNKGVLLSPGESLKAKVRVLPDVNGPLPVNDVNFIVETSAGTFTKVAPIANSNGSNGTSFFAAYTAPLVGFLLVILLVLFLLALRAKLSKRKGKYETDENEELGASKSAVEVKKDAGKENIGVDKEKGNKISRNKERSNNEKRNKGNVAKVSRLKVKENKKEENKNSKNKNGGKEIKD